MQISLHFQAESLKSWSGMRAKDRAYHFGGHPHQEKRKSKSTDRNSNEIALKRLI